METVSYACTMARYNRWMNERLYEHCGTLSDRDRKDDRGAFFKSIHGTLNHILLGDRLWLSRFLGRDFQIESLSQELYADFADLTRQRWKDALITGGIGLAGFGIGKGIGAAVGKVAGVARGAAGAGKLGALFGS